VLPVGNRWQSSNGFASGSRQRPGSEHGLLARLAGLPFLEGLGRGFGQRGFWGRRSIREPVCAWRDRPPGASNPDAVGPAPGSASRGVFVFRPSSWQGGGFQTSRRPRRDGLGADRRAEAFERMGHRAPALAGRAPAAPSTKTGRGLPGKTSQYSAFEGSGSPSVHAARDGAISIGPFVGTSWVGDGISGSVPDERHGADPGFRAGKEGRS